MKPFTIIQGGMGVAISHWGLARTVSQLGQLGVVSGTGISHILITRLMDGDTDGSTRRALAHFPFQQPVEKILRRFYIQGGKRAGQPYKILPPHDLHPSRFLDEITVIANFVEVFLAKEGHDGLVGINLLEKIQLPNMASLYGAMLADVDFVLMGAGIPVQVPKILDQLACHEATSYRIDVLGARPDDDYRLPFDPKAIFPGVEHIVGNLKRPYFLPIISSVVLAQALLKRSEGKIDGFVIEGPLAGGHNAPPRGQMKLNDIGEPIYGEKDQVDLEKMKQLGLPFWLAGGYATPEQLQNALEAGAAGIQVGTAFAFCNESGMAADTRGELLQKLVRGEAQVFTSPVASPTGFPFKVASLEGSMSEAETYEDRPRLCDLGFLRTPYKKNEHGSLGFRCPAEPLKQYAFKGGAEVDTERRVCLCNGLSATAGYPQHRRDGYVEKPIVTAGDDFLNLKRFLRSGQDSYSAEDVITYLLQSEADHSGGT